MTPTVITILIFKYPPIFGLVMSIAGLLFLLLSLKGLAHAKIIKKSVILFWFLIMTIWCKHVRRLELQIFIIFVLRIHQLG